MGGDELEVEVDRMAVPDHRDVGRAVAEMVRVLSPHAGLDWGVPAGYLTWSCWQTAAHVGHDLLAYAGQLAARPERGYLPVDLTVRPDATPADLLTVAAACGTLLGQALAAADPQARAWHFGSVEPAGFAALGVAETLLHTYDITDGLGLDWSPPAELCAGVLRRLRPDLPPTDDPAGTLLRATGRVPLPDGTRVTDWRWRVP